MDPFELAQFITHTIRRQVAEVNTVTRYREPIVGFVAADDADFAARGCEILTDDALWGRLHSTALDRQRRWSWDDAAGAFEALLPA